MTGGSSGFLLPLSVLAPEGGKELQGTATIFLYDGQSSTVKKHNITVGGVRDNRLIVTDGLAPAISSLPPACPIWLMDKKSSFSPCRSRVP